MKKKEAKYLVRFIGQNAEEIDVPVTACSKKQARAAVYLGETNAQRFKNKPLPKNIGYTYQGFVKGEDDRVETFVLQASLGI